MRALPVPAFPMRPSPGAIAGPFSVILPPLARSPSPIWPRAHEIGVENGRDAGKTDYPGGAPGHYRLVCSQDEADSQAISAN